jgi:hypothetical protein
MSIPSIDPLAMAPTDIDPRFRYGFRSIPEDFPEATSRFYLPTQTDSRFWPLKYEDFDNECFDSLTTRSVPCNSDGDCNSYVDSWCNDGQARTIKMYCDKTSQVCVFDFDSFVS